MGKIPFTMEGDIFRGSRDENVDVFGGFKIILPDTGPKYYLWNTWSTFYTQGQIETRFLRNLFCSNFCSNASMLLSDNHLSFKFWMNVHITLNLLTSLFENSGSLWLIETHLPVVRQSQTSLFLVEGDIQWEGFRSIRDWTKEPPRRKF